MSEPQSVISPLEDSENLDGLDANEEGGDVDSESVAREEEALEQEEVPDKEEQVGQGAELSGDREGRAILRVSHFLKSASGAAAPQAAPCFSISQRPRNRSSQIAGAITAPEAGRKTNDICESKVILPIFRWSESPWVTRS